MLMPDRSEFRDNPSLTPTTWSISDAVPRDNQNTRRIAFPPICRKTGKQSKKGRGPVRMGM
jgi:hypothetical protein